MQASSDTQSAAAGAQAQADTEQEKAYTKAERGEEAGCNSLVVEALDTVLVEGA